MFKVFNKKGCYIQPFFIVKLYKIDFDEIVKCSQILYLRLQKPNINYL